METNPTVEPDAPLPSEEPTTPAHSAENTPPEPVPAAAAEIAAESAAAEALPEPLPEVETAAEHAEPVPESEAQEQAEVETEPAPSETSEPEAQPGQHEAEAEAIPQGEAAPAEIGTPEEISAETAPDTVAPSEPESESEPAAAPDTEEAPVAETAPAEGEATQDVLATLADQAQTTRLSPADEERAGTLLKEALLEGRAGVVRAVAALPKLPWVIGVNAVTTVWSELKPAFRTQLLAGLVRTKGDAAKRIRLSLARGLFKQDVPIALKIAAGVSKEMREKETGGISAKHAQIFANVFIGRAKPWIAQIPLAEMKPSDADTLVHCALLSALSLPHAPITQLGVIKWAAEAGRLAKAHQTVIDAAHKSLGRWSGKWQNALRKEVADLPETFASALKSSKGAAEVASKPEDLPGLEAAEPASTAEDSAGPAVIEPEPDADAEAAEVASETPLATAEEPDAEPAEVSKAEGVVEQAAAGEASTGPQQPKQRPVYESKTVPRKPQQGQPQQQSQQAQPQQSQPQQSQPQQGGGKPAPSLKDASVPDLLRQLESQFQGLRSELHSTQSKLRQRDEDLRRAQKKASERTSAPVIEGEPTPEELARLNRQLESRNEELQARIEELTMDSEARAVSVGAISGEPVSDPNAQLRTLLSLKLQEDYEDFLALEKESPDIVVQQHYRTVLRHVFQVLMQEGVHYSVHPPEGAQE